MLTAKTTNEHAVAWAMLRAALRLSSAEVDALLDKPAGYCADLEATRRRVTVDEWGALVRSLVLAWRPPV